ncbi:MAG: prephenate dehydrogenase/arogenate dehydrogenase family protein [Butyrivibrio sp.]|uniref:prephenate dehydrogenase/arogenate dehydrogenase family protein n=1 Tax=Butyrivibrio sp. TaxID=28121 RepID=UPI001B1B1EB8|nr:prephenate dehydrogenase/arogenate dehydrogenase family protein [Butyrivibrio sp.]MBO6242211.1 prephenate dehydrogenase/arogenate dehydrogenase family protein [Butyrivibrio sp.]
MSFKKFGFIGLGLIGGSIARAIKRSRPDSYIVAYTPHKETVDSAHSEGIVDKPLYEIGNDFSDCDIIFLCAPVEINNENLDKLAPFINENTLITDIGSVKTGIHDKVKELGLENQFIGGHPMAGTERIGFSNSKASLLENAYYILTKTEFTGEEKIKPYYDLVKEMGAIPLVVPFMQHDYITAAISHVPHVVSASLVNLVHDNDSEDQLMKLIAAGGFKDITRISSSSPVMWQQICTTNSYNISDLLSKYIDSLIDIKLAIDEHDGDKLYNFFNSAKQYRESFIETSSGPIMQTFTIHVDIADKPGNLAKVATLLSDNNINIKNIGIVHNREYERGTLRIELHDQSGKDAAINTLKENGYPIRNS